MEPQQAAAATCRRAEGSQSEAPFQTPPSLQRVVAAGGEPLAAPVRADFEQLFGHDFSQIQVHVESAAEASEKRGSAHAYTVGEHVVFGSGWYRPTAPEGPGLMAHELTHVLQQLSGGSTADPPGWVSSPGSPEEHQA